MAPVRTWYVAFGESDGRWWDVFLKRGFRHCFAFGVTNGGRIWSIVELTVQGTRVHALDQAAFDAWSKTHLVGHSILKLAVCDRKSFLVAPHTCVSCCQKLLGLSSFGAFTPWQLWRQMQRAGARQVQIGASAPICEDQ